jgi:tetratricopeptide (TPR) repeat protein
LAAVEQALAVPPSTDDQVTATLAEDAPVARRRFRIRRSRWFLVGAVASFAAAAVVLVPAFTSGRLPGQTPTGSVNLSASQQTTRTLEQAATLVNQDRLGEAASLYQSVLVTHPNDEVALAQLGWLEYRIGRQGGSSTLLTDARTKLLRATVLAPKDWAPYLYLGTIALLQDGDASTAVSEFDQFLANSPPGSVVAEAASTIRSAFRQADRPLPPGVPTT